MRGGNYEIEVEIVEREQIIPKLPFLCTHSQLGTYCGKGLVIRNPANGGDEYTLVDLGNKDNGGSYNTVFSRDTLADLMSIGDIKPREGKIIIFEGGE